jgi:MFS transporter, PAT family, beta-lactamase induction signal transducer AmpG
LSAEPHRVVRPWFWAILNLPFGATSGFVSVMLGFILKKQGMGDDVIASLVALNLLPHTWKVLWAPIADSTLTRKRWYILSNVVSCGTILGLAFVPITKGNLGVIEILVFANSVAITLVGMAVEGLMAHATPPEQRGRAAGWFQVGNVGGAGVGGGLGLWLAEEISTKFAFIVIAAVLFACMAALLAVPEAPRLPAAPVEKPAAGASGRPPWLVRIIEVLLRLLEVIREVLQMLFTRRGLVAIVLVFTPIGSAAAQGLFSGSIATQWGADANLVATTTGFAAGIAAAVGCLLGGLLSDRIGRRNAYLAGGALLALIAIAMATSPQNPTTYAIYTLAYQFGGGVAFGTFTGFVLEVIGTGAAATKYNALASLSNFPIWYMTKVDGWASSEHGPVNMLFVDAGSEVAGIVVFIVVLLLVKPDKERMPKDEPKPEFPKARVVS